MHATFARLTAWASAWSGSPAALASVLVITAVWLGWGFASAWSEAWSSVAGAVTGVVSIVLLVLLHGAQSADTAAIRAQLTELVRVNPEADDALIDPDVTVLVERRER